MRLTCPNCGARYEVDEAMIPPEGRDVQCSNCTTTWFQPGLSQGSEIETDAAPPPEPPVAQATRQPTEAQSAEVAAARRQLDPEVRDVLREEAERETALRQQEGVGLEHQDEMPLEASEEAYDDDEDDGVGAAVSGLIAEVDDIGELQDAPRERARDEAAARYDGAEEDNADDIDAQVAAVAAASAAASSRRDLLPDIEEINSTLRANETRSVGDLGGSDIDTVETRPRRRTGTRLGFALAILIFAALVAIYANAPRIIAAVPQTEPVLTVYVAQVEQLRTWIDEIAQGALTSDEAPVASTPTPDTPAPEPQPAETTASEPESEATEPADAPDEDAQAPAGDEAQATEGN